MSSWIGKLRKGFDTFCVEAKGILPQKPLQNVKLFVSDLDVFSAFKPDSEQGKGPKPDEMEEKVDLHSENKSSNEKKDVTESAEMEEKIVMTVDEKESPVVEAEIEDLDSDINNCTDDEVEHVTFREPRPFLLRITSNGYLQLKLDVEEFKSRYPHLFRFSDSNPEIQSLNFCTDLGGEESIEDGSLSPSSGSVESSPSLASEETEESESSSDDEVTESDDCTPRTINSTFDYESESEAESGPLDIMTFPDSDSVSVGIESHQGNEEMVEEINEWERLDADFKDEDWEIV